MLVLGVDSIRYCRVGREDPSDRYEPLPGVAQLPGWIWRKMGRGTRVGLGVVLLATMVLAVPLAAGIRQSKQQNAKAERRERAENRAQAIRKLEREQRPRFGRYQFSAADAAAAGEPPETRARLVDELSDAILVDSLRRARSGEFEKAGERVECEALGGESDSEAPGRDLSRRFSCIAVTSEIERSANTVGVMTGHPYRAQVDFESGRYAFCKISGQADLTLNPLVTTPRVCGGR